MTHYPNPRLHVCRFVAALAATGMLLPALRAQAQSNAPDAAQLAKYDKNHNGVLDPDELAAMQADDAKAANVAVTSTATASTTNPVDKDVVEMTPFEVKSDSKGYFASNTLSGTRINSSIEDLGASITVIPKQQMEDFAMVDVNDLFTYEANTEGTQDFTSFTVDRNGGVSDNIQSSPTTANRIRGFDSANIAVGNFAANSRIPVDTAFIDSAEVSRGPNSNIFGLGNASGTVNLIPSQARINRDSTRLQFRGDSYGGYRGNFDVNRSLVKGKLAIRAIGVYDSKGYLRKPSADITHRGEVMVTYRPFSKTSLMASYESYHLYARRPNSITPRDFITDWRADGMPTWDPTTFTAYKNGVAIGTFPQSQDANLPLGLISNGTGFYNRPSMYIDGGQVAFWSVNRTTNTNNANNPNTNVRFLESSSNIARLRGTTLPLFQNVGVSDKSIYDWTKYNVVAPDFVQDKSDNYTVELDQTVLNGEVNKLFLQGAWRLEDFDDYNRNSFIAGTSMVLYVDPNQKLLDGRPNPYYLRPYLGSSEPTVFRSPEVNDNFRFQANYQLDLTRHANWMKWLGRHTVTGYNETRRITDYTLRHRLAVLDDHLPWTSPANRAGGNAAARAYFKYYLGDNQGQNVDYGGPALYGPGGTYNFNWFNGATNQWVTEPAKFGETGFLPSTATRREVRSEGLVVQDYFLQDRIVGTWGVRKDKNRSRTVGAVLGSDGFVDYTPINQHRWGPWTEAQGTTRTQGVVVKPFRSWKPLDRLADAGGMGGYAADFVRSLAFFYNQSDSFQPAAAQYNLFGDILPDPTGHTRDYGLSFNVSNKLIARIDFYKTTQVNSRSGDGGTLATRAERIDFPQGGSTDSFNLFNNATQWVTQLHPDYTPAQTDQAVADIMQLPRSFISTVQGLSISETSDQIGKGMEAELNYNPTPSWTFKFTAAQQKSIDANLSPNIQRYIDQRLPIWQKIVDPTTNQLWWTEAIGSGGAAANFFSGVVQNPLRIAIANQGKSRTQVKEWTWRLLGNYRFREGHVRGLSLGGSVRWDDKSSIGYLGDADPDGIIRTLNSNKPVWDPARYYFDFNAAYPLHLFHDKVRASVQLNVRNVFENGRLQAVAVNPDGTPYAYRIVDPRQFILTMTFDL